ncbi:MAG: tRNA epoxyqueuosine(34) reductase QueG [Ilumatobacteraceae bacterium]|nr:tRNA epoxyqueuosine(34) reductase QueG [Ilumatobacteraceae bacterium]
MPAALPTIESIRATLAAAQIHHVGVAPADVLADTRAELLRRRDLGLHADMQFTYRNPERSTDPGRAVDGARSVIVAARSYVTDQEPPPPSGPGPHASIGRYAWVDHYAPLRAELRNVARSIRRAGHRAVAFADDNAIVDRAVAHRAGLGWYGKNANLLLPGAGSFFVLGCIITTAEYTPAPHPAADGCGDCVRCIDACPTGAIVEPGVIDANRCLAWVLQRPGSIPVELRAAVGDRIYGCDDCQDVCPITVRLGERTTVELTGDERTAISAVELLEASDEWIEERCGWWYIAERDLRWLRRNALIVMGNGAATDDQQATDLLVRYATADDEVLAEHARWALARVDSRRAAQVML